MPVRSVNAAAGQALSYSATGLPAGLVIDPGTGTISGTLPGTPGSTSVTVAVSGTGLTPALQTFSWNVAGPVRLSRIRAQSGLAGSPQFLQVAASDGLTGCTLRFTAAGLPPGLAIGPCGLISGWLTRPGTFHPAISVRDTAGDVLAVTAFSWHVGRGRPPGRAGTSASTAATAAWPAMAAQRASRPARWSRASGGPLPRMARCGRVTAAWPRATARSGCGHAAGQFFSNGGRRPAGR